MFNGYSTKYFLLLFDEQNINLNCTRLFVELYYVESCRESLSNSRKDKKK